MEPDGLQPDPAQPQHLRINLRPKAPLSDDLTMQLGRFATAAGRVEWAALLVLFDSSGMPWATAQEVAKTLSFSQMLDLARRLVARMEPPIDPTLVTRFDEWRKAANAFMAERNTVLHSGLWPDGAGGMHSISRSKQRVHSHTVNELDAWASAGFNVAAEGMSIAAHISQP